MIYIVAKTYTGLTGNTVWELQPGTIGISSQSIYWEFGGVWGTVIVPETLALSNPSIFNISGDLETLVSVQLTNTLNQLVTIPANTIGIAVSSNSGSYKFGEHWVDADVVESNITYFTSQTDLPFWNYNIPQSGDSVWEISDTVSNFTWNDTIAQQTLWSIGLVKPTEIEALDKMSQMWVLKRIQNLASSLNNGWVPDWANGDQLKYRIIFSKGIASIVSSNTDQEIGGIYFRNAVTAQQALDYLNEEIYVLRDVVLW